MLATRYKKIIRDQLGDISKSIVLLVSLSIGLFGACSLLGVYVVIKREIKKNYRETKPASATVIVQNDSIRQSDLILIRRIPGITDAERRSTVTARMKVGDDWYRIVLFVIDNFSKVDLSIFQLESGSLPPPTGTMLVERNAFQVMKSKIGRSIEIRTPEGNLRYITISGSVYDGSVAPAGQEQCGYGYITLNTSRWLGVKKGLNELELRVSNSIADNESQITERSIQAAKVLEKNGYKIQEIQVPEPEKHPHQSQMEGLLTIFILFFIMLSVLACILVSLSINSLMIKQTREIGVMKTIGANASQISVLYFLMILLITIPAIIIAISLTGVSSSFLIKQSSKMLNLNIYDYSIPIWVFVAVVAFGIIAPLLVVALPVLRGSRISIIDALNTFGVRKGALPKRHLKKGLIMVRFPGMIYTLAWRNVYRQTSKFILSVSLLAMGGAVFITSLNESAAWKRILNDMLTNNKYNFEIRFDKPIRTDTLLNEIRKFRDVTDAEEAFYTTASITNKNRFIITHTYSDQGHGATSIYGVPLNSGMNSIPLIKGRWLNSDSSCDIVLTQAAIGNLSIGDSVGFTIDGYSTKWKIIGLVQQFGYNALGYVSLNSLRRLMNKQGKANMLRISLSYSDETKYQTKIRQVMAFMDSQNIPILMSMSDLQRQNIMGGHVEVLIDALGVIAVLVVLVGIIGLISTISMNILERTREFGIIKTIGGNRNKIFLLIMAEGFIVGAISFIISILLSIPFSAFTGKYIGHMSFGIALPLVISTRGIVVWLIAVIFGTVLGMLYPALRASRLKVQQALAY